MARKDSNLNNYDMTEFKFCRRIIFREYPLSMLVLFVNELLGAALVLLGVGTLIPFISSLLGGGKEMNGPLDELTDFLGISQWSNIQILSLLVVLMIFRIILDFVRRYLAGWVGISLNSSIRSSINSSIAKINWIEFSKIDQGKYLQCMIAESPLAGGAVSDLASAFAYGVITCTLLGWIAINSFDTFLIFIIFGAIFIITNKRIMMPLRKCSEDRIELMSQLNTKLVDIKYTFKILLIENFVSKKISIIRNYIDLIALTEKRQLLLSIIAENYFIIFGLLVITGITIAHFMSPNSSGGELLFNLVLLQRITSYFTSFQVKRQAMVQKIPSYEACLKFTNNKELTKELNTNSNNPIFQFGVEAENISFAYDENKNILKNISFNLPSTGIVFFIGPSGSGKTTLIDLIAGLFEVDEGSGRLLVDGINFKEINKAKWSDLIAYVPQDSYIPFGTIREYLTFACVEISEEEIWAALRLSDAEGIVTSLPLGLDTTVISGGLNFSGGERHRLSIARALIRKVKIIFLDEPSAALDMNSEKFIFNSLRSLSEKILVVVVTHSDKIVNSDDIVYVFDKGNLIWNGIYHKLPY